MPKRMYTEEYVQDIADAIREKNKKTNKYTISEMAPAIRALGGGLIDTQLIINTAEYTYGNLEVT